jgi:hypothetical protein
LLLAPVAALLFAPVAALLLVLVAALLLLGPPVTLATATGWAAVVFLAAPTALLPVFHVLLHLAACALAAVVVMLCHC